MSKFAELAASACEAHEDVLGGGVVCTPPGGTAINTPAVVYPEKVVTKRTGLGAQQVTTRKLAIRNPSLAIKMSWKVSVDNQPYAIQSIERKSGRLIVTLERAAPEEISRPEYRGGRS